MPILKNPKGRLVSVTQEAAEYLLSSRPTKTITGVEQKDDKGQPVAVVKSQHEQGYTKPSEK